MALLRRDAGAAWWRDLVPGALIVTTFEGDTVAHERLLLWPVDEKMWCILALDGDVYVEPVTKNFDWGVLDTNPLDDVGTVPDEFPVRVYRFRDHPRADALKELIRDGRAVVRAELGREAPEVSMVLTPSCERVPLESGGLRAGGLGDTSDAWEGVPQGGRGSLGATCRWALSWAGGRPGPAAGAVCGAPSRSASRGGGHSSG
ncbi:unnamed protein product [Prorocentrum cordatum]|uniref:Uncharacterized protein n=1 Tax=Prorocentrum cordatum TaxID=2364126 RepID=A0ABN9PGY3_9DINO|nr:unnamed protein product [Polarella glacialis]